MTDTYAVDEAGLWSVSWDGETLKAILTDVIDGSNVTGSKTYNEHWKATNVYALLEQ